MKYIYKKKYNNPDIGFDTYMVKTDKNIFSLTWFCDSESLNIYTYHKDSVFVNSELKQCIPIGIADIPHELIKVIINAL
jgi:hypothetical protein